LARFQCPLVDGGINLTAVVDQGAALGQLAAADEARDGDNRQQADDGHHDHDFHEREG
jgi:hypothetical protein